MFQKFSSKVNRIATLDSNAFMADVFSDRDLQADVVLENQNQLYELGIEADGTPTGNYSKKTVASKMAYGERYDHITLKDTGAFYGSMRVVNQGEGIIISGDTDKGDQDLSDRWPRALGLTSDSIEELKDETIHVINLKLRELLQ
jgi:hypothetical protein